MGILSSLFFFWFMGQKNISIRFANLLIDFMIILNRNSYWENKWITVPCIFRNPDLVNIYVLCIIIDDYWFLYRWGGKYWNLGSNYHVRVCCIVLWKYLCYLDILVHTETAIRTYSWMLWSDIFWVDTDYPKCRDGIFAIWTHSENRHLDLK